MIQTISKASNCVFHWKKNPSNFYLAKFLSKYFGLLWVKRDELSEGEVTLGEVTLMVTSHVMLSWA